MKQLSQRETEATVESHPDSDGNQYFGSWSAFRRFWDHYGDKPPLVVHRRWSDDESVLLLDWLARSSGRLTRADVLVGTVERAQAKRWLQERFVDLASQWGSDELAPVPDLDLRLVVATDGSSRRSPDVGGWAWYVDEDCWAAGGLTEVTNNAAELIAVMRLLEHFPVEIPLDIFCDSTYVINALTKWRFGWKRHDWKTRAKAPIANLDVIQRLDALLSGRDVRFHWVQGHNGHVLNEAADTRARAAASATAHGKKVNSGPKG